MFFCRLTGFVVGSQQVRKQTNIYIQAVSCYTTKHYLNIIFLPFEVIKCNDAHCCDQKHLQLINKFYLDIVYSLLQPSKDVGLLESSCHRLSFHPISGWNDQ